MQYKGFIFCSNYAEISNFDLSNGCALCSHKLGDCFVHFFKSGARRVGESAFLLLAFLSAYSAKEKRLKSFGIKG